MARSRRAREMKGHAAGIMLVTLCFSVGFFPLGCGGGGGNGGGTPSGPGVTSEAVAQRLDGVLKLGWNTINADQVAALLMDGDPENDPYVIDTRDPGDFAKGHIPGAANVPLKSFPSRYLQNPELIPEGQNVVVASYYGGDGNMASLLINAVRVKDPTAQKEGAAEYPWSKTIMMGMMAWNYDKKLSNGHRWEDDLGIKRVNKPTESTPNEGAIHSLPELGNLAGTVEEAVLQRADAYLRSVDDQLELQLTGVELASLLEDNDPTNDPQILSVRADQHYAAGHIPGAMNIYWKDVAQPEEMSILDPEKPTVVYCYTGHTGSLATMALAILGYDTRNLLYGMDGWSPRSDIGAGKLVGFDTIRGWNFPVDDGGTSDLGSLASFVPPSGCEACHTNLTAIFYDGEVANPIQVAAAPPSVGEG